MPSHEELWWIGIERRAHAGIGVARITTNMFDQHIHIFALESVQFTIHQSEITTITVAIDGSKGSEGSQSLCHLSIAYVASVPDLIAGLEVVQILVVPITVGIAQDADSLHFVNFLRMNSAMIFSVSTRPRIDESIQKS